jgi:opacity protein-like surface antigen
MLKHLLASLSVIMLATLTAFPQRAANIGIFAGTAYYLGDINPNRHFYRPSLSLGGIYRYNINSRYAIRFNAYYVKLSGSDLDFPSQVHPDRPMNPAMFTTSLLDVAVQGEFNFLPYTPDVANFAYTPYVAVGIAGGLILSSDQNAQNFLSFPFGLGVKVNFTSRISGGAEWSFRKTFSDRIDGVENPSGVQSFIHNNDWYSVAGIFITYKFFNFAADCPVYK